jgi:hypothetical protein
VPNTLKTQARKPKLWNGRAVVTLHEDDGKDQYFHGVLIGPEGMTYQKALAAIDKAFNDARREAPGEWAYDEVIANAKKAGFDEIIAAAWDEGFAFDDYVEEEE